MKHVAAIAGRELRSMFSTPVAYVVVASYLVVMGFLFFQSLGWFIIQLQQIQAYGMTQLLAQFNLNDYVIAQALGSLSFIMALVVPVVCMRVFAEERASGSIELLLTSPVTSWEITLGKYIAIALFLTLMIGLTAAFPGLLMFYGDPELWQTLAGLLTLWAYALGLAGMCCFISVLSPNQIIAAIVGIIACLLLLLLEFGAETAQTEWVKNLLRYLGTSAHFEPGLRGQVRLEDLTYFGAMAVVFVALTRAGTDSLRWR